MSRATNACTSKLASAKLEMISKLMLKRSNGVLGRLQADQGRNLSLGGIALSRPCLLRVKVETKVVSSQPSGTASSLSCSVRTRTFSKRCVSRARPRNAHLSRRSMRRARFWSRCRLNFLRWVSKLNEEPQPKPMEEGKDPTVKRRSRHRSTRLRDSSHKTEIQISS